VTLSRRRRNQSRAADMVEPLGGAVPADRAAAPLILPLFVVCVLVAIAVRSAGVRLIAA
jgi:hypothetical protein